MENNMQEDTKLHFLRIRERDSRDPFVDPMADIKQVVEDFFRELPMLYKTAMNPEEEKVDYLRAYLKVFTTRLYEDATTSMSDQLEEAKAAFAKKFTPEELWFFVRCFAEYVIALYSLHVRRDGKVDKKERAAFRAGGLFFVLSGMVNPEVWNAMLKSLPEEITKMLGTAPAADLNVSAVCVEDSSKSVDNIKELAAAAMGATGSQSWDSVATACDDYVRTATETTDKGIAASLAFPTYDNPFFEITVDGK